MFYLSAYFEKNRDEYYDKLHSVSAHKDWEGWIVFFMTAVIEQARINSEKAKAILDLYNEMKLEITKATRSQFSIHTLDAIFDRPIFSTTDFIQHSGVPKPTALRILKVLQKEKVILSIREGSGRRAALLMFARLLELVEK
jgi:Fic family protein